MKISKSLETASQTVHRVLQESTGESSEADTRTALAPKQASKAAPDKSYPQYEEKGVQADEETSEAGPKRKRISVMVSIEVGGSPPRKRKKCCTFDAY